MPRIRWNILWPESAPGFHDLPLDEKVRRVLRFDEGRAAIWRAPRPDSPNTVVLYFFRWQVGRGSILRARGHRPDICLPSIGWKQLHDDGIRDYSAGRISLPFRHFQFTHSGRGHVQFAHAFFCVEEDLIRASGGGMNTPQEISELHGLALIPHLWHLVRNGERPLGQQMMQVVYVGERPTPAVEAEMHLAKLIRDIVAIAPPVSGKIDASPTLKLTR